MVCTAAQIASHSLPIRRLVGYAERLPDRTVQTREETIMPTADCGHTYPEQTGVGGTGYATDRETELTMCYPCADERQREAMKTATVFQAYVADDGKTITTWSGGKLADITRRSESASPLQYRGVIHHIRATDAQGREWYGKNSGNGMVITLRLRKIQYHWVLQGAYGHGWEDLTAENTWKEIIAQRNTYRENEGGHYRIIKRKNEE